MDIAEDVDRGLQEDATRLGLVEMGNPFAQAHEVLSKSVCLDGHHKVGMWVGLRGGLLVCVNRQMSSSDQNEAFSTTLN